MTRITIAIDPATEARLRLISEEMGCDIWRLCAALVEETALDYFRHRRADDPARAVPTLDLRHNEGTWQ